MQSLFATPTPTRFPEIHTRRSVRKSTPRPSRYGESNPQIFHLPCELPNVAPLRPLEPLMPLTQKDPFGEWFNAEHQEQAQVLAALLALPNDYDVSAAYIRAARPRLPHEGLKFWNSPLPRAHAMNCLLNRGERAISQVHRDLCLKHDRLYEYMNHWGMRWSRLERRTLLCDGAGVQHAAVILQTERDTASAQLRLEGYTLTVQGRFDPRERLFRCREALRLDELVPLPVAAEVAGLTPALAGQVFRQVHTTHRRALVRPDDIRRAVPESYWRTSIADALKQANPCRCAFFDHLTGKCGLDLPLAGREAAATCSEHAYDA